ncbi:MAG: glycine--tRNA ligase subunit beta [Thermacetogeniaceae bacterium]
MDYLLEIGVEELPARLADQVIDQLQKSGEKMLQENRIGFAEISVYTTPRRMTFYVQGIAEVQEDLLEEVKGPPKKVAFDESGQPTKAAQGFARSQNVPLESLMVRSTPAGEYVFAEKRIKGQPTAQVLSELIPQLISSLSFTRPMRWGSGDFRFIRPIRWLVSLLGDRIVDFEINGLHPGYYTYGLRNYSKEPLEVHNPDEYFQKLKDASVILDQKERKEKIWELVREEAAQAGGMIQPDDELLNEVTHLVESPTPICGGFDPRLLKLPPEVVITPMKEHQRYFPVWDEEGNLMPLFIACANGPVNKEIVRQGNEKVLRARLHDAEFFFHEDIKTALEDKVEKLEKVVHMEGLGTIYDKVKRLVALSGYLADVLGLTERQKEVAERAAYLSKADLVTDMVFEFPELQGIMGGYYARISKENKEVCRAIREHYMPRFSGDKVPASKPGAILAIADKIDNLTGCFALGLEPTGSQDPFALRRQALGICHIIINQEFAFSLEELVAKAYENLRGMELTYSFDQVRDKMMDFFKARLRFLFLEEGYAYDTVEAALGSTFDNIILVRKRLEALTAVRSKPEFEFLLTAYTRASHLARQAEGDEVDPTLLGEKGELELYDAWTRIKKDVVRLLDKGKYREALLHGSKLAGPLDRFFNQVMVMVEDIPLRRNRLALLKDIAKTLGRMGDLEKIVREN